MTQPVTHGRLRILADPAWGWCAGLRHPPEAEYPAGRFTPVQIDQLRADPALVVEDLDEAKATSSRAASVGAPSPPDGAATGGEGEPLAATHPEAEVAASNSDQANGEVAPAQEADVPAAASASAPRPRKKG